MKKLFTLLMLMVCAVGTMNAAGPTDPTDLKTKVITETTLFLTTKANADQWYTDGWCAIGKSSSRGSFVEMKNKGYTINPETDETVSGVKCTSSLNIKNGGDTKTVYMQVSGIEKVDAYILNSSSSAVRTACLTIIENGQETKVTEADCQASASVKLTISNLDKSNVYLLKFDAKEGGKGGDMGLYAVRFYNEKELSSEIITKVTVNNAQVSDEDLIMLTTNKTLTLDEPKYQAAPTVVFTKTKTFTDGTSKSVDETVTATEGTDYFTATTKIGEDTYTLNLARDKSVKSSDATLKSLSVNGGLVKDFNAETLKYDVELPVGTTEIPTVAAEASSTVAKVDITQATALPGTATVVVAAEDGITTSTYIINFTVSKGSSEKGLTKAMFSNGFDGFIKGNTVEAYYMEGTEVPTLNATVSDKATYSVSGDVLTVTAEDGTMAEYTIKLESVAPYTGLGRVFDGTENGWIKTGYSFDATNNKGWRFSKNVNDDKEKRITDGRNRLYFFVDACNSITLTTAQGITSNRNIAVYVNNVKNSSISQAPKYNADGTAVITIPCDKNAPCMVAVVSNQTSGDGGFGEIVVDKDAPASITLNSYGYNTYSNANTVTVTGAVAYTCTVNNETKKVVLKELGTVVPAGQGVLLKGEANGTVSFAFGGEEPVIAQNDFQPVLKATATPADKAIYVLNGNQFKKYVGATLVANKAYIELGSTSGAKALSIEFDGETTDIGGIKDAGADDNAPVYNLQGQRVDINTKGIVIKNGKKIINK